MTEMTAADSQMDNNGSPTQSLPLSSHVLPVTSG
jgi:hypothetical protein